MTEDRKEEGARMPKFQHSGILLVDKPTGWTSHDVVNFVRRRFNVKKVGHCGTLDPSATGLLVLLLGSATRLSQDLSGTDKTYSGTMLLGVATDSQDMEGQVVSKADPGHLAEEAVRSEFARFAGEQMQLPPMFSAVKKDGKKLYDLARQGKEVEREPKKIFISAIEVSRVEIPEVDFQISCSKGTYVRTICHDIGKNLSCGGALLSLRRTRSGDFSIDDSHTVEAMKDWDHVSLFKALKGNLEF